MTMHSVINKVFQKAINSIPSHQKGKLAELIATSLMLVKGYKVIARNDNSGIAEVDLLVTKGDTVVIVEVKYRGNEDKTHLAIHPAQKKRLEMQGALLQRKYPTQIIRIDGVFIFPQFPFLSHIENLWRS